MFSQFIEFMSTGIVLLVSYNREHILYPHLKCKPFYHGISYGIPNQVLVGACSIPLGLGIMGTRTIRSLLSLLIP
jgi:hypothetical protein